MLVLVLLLLLFISALLVEHWPWSFVVDSAMSTWVHVYMYGAGSGGAGPWRQMVIGRRRHEVLITAAYLAWELMVRCMCVLVAGWDRSGCYGGRGTEMWELRGLWWCGVVLVDCVAAR